MPRFLVGWNDLWRRLPLGARVLAAVFSGASLVGILSLLSGGGQMPLMVLAVVTAALTIYYLLKAWLLRIERRKSKGMAARLAERMFRPQPKLPDESVEEENARKQFQRRWQDVYETLRERGYDYYSFPWYLVIGASQSGKTTTIQKSSQEFPIGDKPVVDYGGTKNCNWFFTNKAILIDTAGRYVDALGDEAPQKGSMAERTQQEWASFLELLREMKPRSPINGLLLFIKVEDVIERDAKKRAKNVETLRRALHDIEYQLQVRVPVYVMVTMCDRLVGFVDFFAHLRGIADRTLFGWSRSGSFDAAWNSEDLRKGLATLCERVDSLGLQFLEDEANRGDTSATGTAVRDRLLSFPEELRALAPQLDDILSKVFAESAYTEQHFLRGVYFTSGLQEGIPAVNACRDLIGEQALRIKEEDVKLLTPESKAYFVADFYEQKVFKEQGLVRLTSREQKRRGKERRVALTAALILVTAVGYFALREGSQVIKVLELQSSFENAKNGDVGAFLNQWEELAKASQAGFLDFFAGAAAAKARKDASCAFEKIFTQCLLSQEIGKILPSDTARTWKQMWSTQEVGALSFGLLEELNRKPKGANPYMANTVDAQSNSLVSMSKALRGEQSDLYKAAGLLVSLLGNGGSGQLTSFLEEKNDDLKAFAIRDWTSGYFPALPASDEPSYQLAVWLQSIRDDQESAKILTDLRTQLRNHVGDTDCQALNDICQWSNEGSTLAKLVAANERLSQCLPTLNSSHEQALAQARELNANLNKLQIPFAVDLTTAWKDTETPGLLKRSGNTFELKAPLVAALKTIGSALSEKSPSAVRNPSVPLGTFPQLNLDETVLVDWLGEDCRGALEAVKSCYLEGWLSALSEASRTSNKLENTTINANALIEFDKNLAEWKQATNSRAATWLWSSAANEAASNLVDIEMQYAQQFKDYWTRGIYFDGADEALFPETSSWKWWSSARESSLAACLDSFATRAGQLELATNGLKGFDPERSGTIRDALQDLKSSIQEFSDGKEGRGLLQAFIDSAEWVSKEGLALDRLREAVRRREQLTKVPLASDLGLVSAWEEALKGIKGLLEGDAIAEFQKAWKSWVGSLGEHERKLFPFNDSPNVCEWGLLTRIFEKQSWKVLSQLFLAPASAMEWPFRLPQDDDDVNNLWRIGWIATVVGLSSEPAFGDVEISILVDDILEARFPRFLRLIKDDSQIMMLELPLNRPQGIHKTLFSGDVGSSQSRFKIIGSERHGSRESAWYTPVEPYWCSVVRLLVKNRVEVSNEYQSLTLTLDADDGGTTTATIKVKTNPKLPPGLPGIGTVTGGG